MPTLSRLLGDTRPPKLGLLWLVGFGIIWAVPAVRDWLGWASTLTYLATGAIWMFLFWRRVRAIWWISTMTFVYVFVFTIVLLFESGPRHETLRQAGFDLAGQAFFLALLLSPSVRGYFFWRHKARDLPARRDFPSEGGVYAPSRALTMLNWLLLAFFAFVTFVVVRGFIQDIITQAGPPAPGKSGRWVTAGFAIAAVGVWLLYAALVSRLTRVRLVVDQSGLTVINYLRTHSLRWEEIRGFRAAGAYWGISIDLRNGKTINANAVQKSNLMTMLNIPSRADRVVTELNEELWKHRGMPAPPPPSPLH